MNLTAFICLPHAIFHPRTVRQLITHLVMLQGPTVCGCQKENPMTLSNREAELRRAAREAQALATPLLEPGPWNRYLGAAPPGLVLELLSEVERLRTREGREATGSTCTCIHPPEHHDPVSGACLVTNDRIGPCPCASTPAGTAAALRRVFEWKRDLVA